MFDLSPCRSNSRAARYLMFSLAVNDYVLDAAHINHTLQALLETIVGDLNTLATTGLRVDGKAPSEQLCCLGGWEFRI